MTVRVVRLRAEHHEVALGIGEAAPRLSWQVVEAPPSWRQIAYEVRRVDAGSAALGQSVRHEGDEQVLVAWPFEPLASRDRVVVQVRVTSADGLPSGWSEPLPIEIGLLSPGDWSAVAITADPPGQVGDALDTPAPALRRDFDVAPGLVSARLYATALGVYSLHLNGAEVGDEVLAPGWTSYHHRLRYQTHDVTPLLREGPNTVGALLGNGWYRGFLGFTGQRAHYGSRRALLAQLELTYADGRVERVGTDPSWRSASSHIRSDDLYNGQATDLTARLAGWDLPGGGAGWGGVEVVPLDLVTLVAPEGPPVRRTGTVAARTMSPSPDGGVLVDFGQNLVGWVRLTVRPGPGAPPAGASVQVRHAEVLENGHLGVRPLRLAKATDTYVLAGDEGATGEVLEPLFTFHGFRYAEIRGLPDLALTDVEAVVVGSDLRRTGWFSCSEPDVERLHENVVWGMRGNFLDVPTDCPQRNERLGWTGDLQVFSPTASFLFDCAGFLSSWLKDLAADQSADGIVPLVVPDVLGGFGGPLRPVAAWGDAGVVVPGVLRERFGDTGLMERQWPSMQAWVDLLLSSRDAGGVWTGGFQLGDWLDPTAPPDDPAAAQAAPDLVAAAHLVLSTTLLARAAEVLGRIDDARHYGELAEESRRAVLDTYTTARGRVISDCPTAYALALQFPLLTDPEQRRLAGDRLADLVRGAGYRISTGFVGTPLVTDALTATGHEAVAYRLLLQRECPSWLYTVRMGATTIWERWDSMLPDGSINPGEMTSFNHYALGAVADWLHRTVAGLAPGAPGYRRIVVRPVLGGGLTHAAARHLTPYGEASVAWQVSGERWQLDVEVPPGCTAEVSLPDSSPVVEVGNGRHSWSLSWPVVGGVERPAATATVREALDDLEVARPLLAALTAHGLADDDLAVSRFLLHELDVRLVDLTDAVATLPFVRDRDGLRAELAELVS